MVFTERIMGRQLFMIIIDTLPVLALAVDTEKKMAAWSGAIEEMTRTRNV
jgi:hypothetical protein